MQWRSVNVKGGMPESLKLETMKAFTSQAAAELGDMPEKLSNAL